MITKDTRPLDQRERIADWYAKASSIGYLQLGPRFALDFERQFAREYERDEMLDGRARIQEGSYP